MVQSECTVAVMEPCGACAKLHSLEKAGQQRYHGYSLVSQASGTKWQAATTHSRVCVHLCAAWLQKKIAGKSANFSNSLNMGSARLVCLLELVLELQIGQARTTRVSRAGTPPQA